MRLRRVRILRPEFHEFTPGDEVMAGMANHPVYQTVERFLRAKLFPADNNGNGNTSSGGNTGGNTGDYALHPTPYTLHTTPYTLNPTS